MPYKENFINTVAQKDTIISLTAINNQGCRNDTAFTLNVIDSIKVIEFDTLIHIGEYLEIGQSMPSESHRFVWSKSPELLCTTCNMSEVKTLQSAVYYLKISDENACFENYSKFTVRIDEKVIIGLPEAFSPNGDGINELIYADGVGIRKLDSFKIYDRNGQLMFESSSMDFGWDGYFNGSLQAADSYVYNIIASGYGISNPIEKRGTFKLIR